MKAAAAIERLSSQRLESEIRNGLASWDNPDPAHIEEAIAWFRHVRDDMVAVLREVEDDDQAKETLAINYIEVKSRWIAINTKINYQNFRLGSCDPIDAFRGTAISMMLVELEQVLDPDDIEKITEFLAQPVRRAA